MNLNSFQRSSSSSATRSLGRAALLGAAGLAASAITVHYLAKRGESQHRPIGKFAHIGNTRIHYVDRGSGPPVVVLHGNGSMLEEMESSHLLDQLAQVYRVIALDRPGFGLSTRPIREWTPEKEAELILALMHQLGLERPVIVAHSWATLVALSLALEQPDAVTGLVLIGGYYYPTTRVDAAMQRIIAMPVVGDLLRNTLWPLISRATAPLGFKQMFSPLRPTAEFLQEYSVAMATRPVQLRAVADDTVEMPKAAARLAPRYRELQLPVDLIAGANDKVVTPSHHSRRLNGELHNSFFDEVPDAGHMVHHAHPKLVERRVAHVLDRALHPVASGISSSLV